MLELWLVLVPTIHPHGNPVRLRHHRLWDTKVRSIAGGLTILTPVKGQWLSQIGQLIQERMIPVMIICTQDQMTQIVQFTAKHYKQQAVTHASLSNRVFITHFPENALPVAGKAATTQTPVES